MGGSFLLLKGPMFRFVDWALQPKHKPTVFVPIFVGGFIRFRELAYLECTQGRCTSYPFHVMHLNFKAGVLSTWVLYRVREGIYSSRTHVSVCALGTGMCTLPSGTCTPAQQVLLFQLQQFHLEDMLFYFRVSWHGLFVATQLDASTTLQVVRAHCMRSFYFRKGVQISKKCACIHVAIHSIRAPYFGQFYPYSRVHLLSRLSLGF